MNSRKAFEAHVLPHLDAAYNLARWLLRDESSAEDAVQEASIRAFRYIDGLRGDNARPWFLGIVRNTCFTFLDRRRNGPDVVEFDQSAFDATVEAVERSPADPSKLIEEERMRSRIDAAIQALSPLLREVIVLREFEDLGYAEIAQALAVPIGTVMSRLSRARETLRGVLSRANLGRLQ